MTYTSPPMDRTVVLGQVLVSVWIIPEAIDVALFAYLFEVPEMPTKTGCRGGGEGAGGGSDGDGEGGVGVGVGVGGVWKADGSAGDPRRNKRLNYVTQVLPTNKTRTR